jgi:hypothetical protein
MAICFPNQPIKFSVMHISWNIFYADVYLYLQDLPKQITESETLLLESSDINILMPSVGMNMKGKVT